MLFKTSCQFLLFVFVMCMSVFSAQAGENTPYFVDVYRSRQINSEQIISKFGKQLQEIANIYGDRRNLEKNALKAVTLKDNLDKQLKKLGDFSYIELSLIQYPLNRKIYFTIDVIDKIDQNRLPHFTSYPHHSVTDPYNLVKSWRTYELTAMRLSWNGDLKQVKSCSQLHCVYGFEHADLKKYENIFDTKVPKSKSQLIKVLRYDKDEYNRAAAAYLLGHLRNGQELISILKPYMWQSSSAVRNAVMRVMGVALLNMKATHPDFPIKDAVTALDFPTLTDRNKALVILSALANQPRYAKYIIQHASDNLMEELKQVQLNVHGLAYDTLRNMSHQKYGERDYAAWEAWLAKKKQEYAKQQS